MGKVLSSDLFLQSTLPLFDFFFLTKRIVKIGSAFFLSHFSCKEPFLIVRFKALFIRFIFFSVSSFV